MAIDIISPMAGAVKEHLVTVGDAVSAGQEIIVLESMKMEIPVETTDAGIVDVFFVQPGDTVDEGTALVRLSIS